MNRNKILIIVAEMEAEWVADIEITTEMLLRDLETNNEKLP